MTTMPGETGVVQAVCGLGIKVITGEPSGLSAGEPSGFRFGVPISTRHIRQLATTERPGCQQ